MPPASDNGWNPLAVAFDGTNAYVSGFNNGAAAASVGVVKVNSVLSLAPTFTDLVNTRVTANPILASRLASASPNTVPRPWPTCSGPVGLTEQSSTLTGRPSRLESALRVGNRSRSGTRAGLDPSRPLAPWTG